MIKNFKKESVLINIPSAAVTQTETILANYGNRRRPHEGFVFWAGTKSDSVYSVSLVIAPRLNSRYSGVRISPSSNAIAVKSMRDYNSVEIAQVHSHPLDFVGHSSGDDLYAPFKVDGLISIVVPRFCSEGMLPLEKCGVHMYSNGEFLRLDNEYIKKHFRLVTEKSIFCDAR